MSDMSFWLSVASIPVSLLAIVIGLVSYCWGRHFDASMSRYRYVDELGKEREGVSFSSRKANTFLGRTIGPIGIALAESMYRKEERRLNG